MNAPESNLPFQVTQTVSRGGTTFELLEYKPLSGSDSVAVAEQLYTLNRAGVHLRQLRIRLNNDAVRTEPGVLQFSKGRISMESSTGAGSGMAGLMKGRSPLPEPEKPCSSRSIAGRAKFTWNRPSATTG